VALWESGFLRIEACAEDEVVAGVIDFIQLRFSGAVAFGVVNDNRRLPSKVVKSMPWPELSSLSGFSACTHGPLMEPDSE
jgi:hypothetical protein